MPLEATAQNAHALRVGGCVPFTTIDFPGHLAAVVFLAGCPWRCPYCHNAHLRKASPDRLLPWTQIYSSLAERKDFLEGVVFSGGEPTAQPALVQALADVRSLGLATGLHTAGIFPHRLKKVLPLLDWVGLDIKAPPDARYDGITGRRNSAGLFLRSLQYLENSGVAFSLRTTLDLSLLGPKDQLDLTEWLVQRKLPPTNWQAVRKPIGV
jgi:pyruvate formate lyase activating enzyme